MAGLKKTKDKFGKDITQKLVDVKHGDFKAMARGVDDFNPVTLAKSGLDTTFDAFTPDVPTPKDEVIIPIPDENAAALAARKRRAAKTSTGRDSTILTEGLGG